jgi:hypothetical protein
MMISVAIDLFSHTLESHRNGVVIFLARAIGLFLTIMLAACGSPIETGKKTTDVGLELSATTNTFSQTIPIASGVTFRVQHNEGIRYVVKASTISIARRDFGPFNIKGINELLVDDSLIEVFPKSSSDTSEGGGSGQDFTDFLREYARTLEDTYGLVTRLHMRNVHIILHQAGEDNRDINISAKDLVKEFGSNGRTELYSLEVADNQSTQTLKLGHAVWDTGAGKLISTSPTSGKR